MGCVHSKEISQRAESRRLPRSVEVAGSEGEQHSVASPSVTAADSERTLGVLLEDNEDLLLKVLSCVIDDGLHECRRVCRGWRDACGKLPVKLCVMQPDDLRKMVDFFPEAVSLTLGRRSGGEDTIDGQVIPRLSRLKNLQHLHLSYTKLEKAGSLVTWLPTMDRLVSLSLWIERDVLLDIVQALRRLTNLESLRLNASRFEQTDLEPVTELRGVRELKIAVQLIVNTRGELLFPSLTWLTSLIVTGDSLGEPTPFTIDLQV